jgi:hypothetical protein
VLEFVEQQLLLLLAFVVLEMRDRYCEDPGRSFVDCSAFKALDDPFDPGAFFDPINGSWLVCIWRESPHYQEHDARTF